MEKVNVIKKPVRRKQKIGKENAAPDILSNSLLDNILGDNINDVVGRRSDLGRRSLRLIDTDESIDDVEFNDDALEKEERRREEQERVERERAAAARVQPSGIGLLGTLTQEELDQHYSKCIEMCNRNKVSVKNAFKLQLIDYMKLIVSNQSTKSENLTLMSCTLGASAKIYGLRVDKVYTDMVKILSGKANEVEKDDSDGENAEDGEDEDEEENADDKEVIKKRRKSTDSNEEEEEKDKVNFEAMLLTEAQLNKGKSVEEEPQEMQNLPRGFEYFLECPQLDPDGRLCLNPPVFSHLELEKPASKNNIVLDVPHYNGDYNKLDLNEYIKDYKTVRKHYSVIGGEDGGEESIGLMNSSLAFDPSSNIPDSIRLEAEEHDMDYGDGIEAEPWGPEYDEDEALPQSDIGSGTKLGQISTAQPKSFTAETMAKLVSVKAGDYSFFDNSKIDFWAGPTHWTLKQPKGAKVLKAGELPRKTGKKSCDLSFTYENLINVKKYYSETISSLLARKTILTWSSRRNKIPQNVSYSQKQLLSLMKNDQLMYVKKDSSTNMICNTDLKNDEEETVLTPDDFGLDVEHDANDDDDDNNHFDGDLADPTSPSPVDRLTLEKPLLNESNCELVPAPPKVNKILLKYAKAQKRIDIKKLKTAMWDCMDLESPIKPDEPKEVKFSDVYSILPEKMPSEEASELSFPIAFMALLHMANEKNLSITSNDDNSDVNVKLG